MKSAAGGRGEAGGCASGLRAALDGVVLPRPLRKPARLAARFLQGDFSVPRHATSVMTIALVGGFSLYGAVLGGHWPAMVQFVTARSGFAINDVRIAGNAQTSEIDILDKLGFDGWTSLIGFDASDARARVATLPWIEAATVRKIYPDAVEIAVTERKAYAIWQNGSELSVIEADGRVIAPYSRDRLPTLPFVVGPGAAEKAGEAVALVQQFARLAPRVKAFIRVGDRRWDLRLDTGVTLRLPEDQPARAIEMLLAYDAQDALLDRDIAAIDLRFADRLVVKLTPEGAERRDAAVQASIKAQKKLERKI